MSNLFCDKNTYIEREAKKAHKADPRFSVRDWQDDLSARIEVQKKLREEKQKQEKK